MYYPPSKCSEDMSSVFFCFTGLCTEQINALFTPVTTALPSLMAACWVGQNSGPIFRHLWTKVYQIQFARVGMSIVCNAIFRLRMRIVAIEDCYVPEIFAIKLQSCAKS